MVEKPTRKRARFSAVLGNAVLNERERGNIEVLYAAKGAGLNTLDSARHRVENMTISYPFWTC